MKDAPSISTSNSARAVGHRLKIIAAIVDPQVIIKILTHPGLARPHPATGTGAALPAVPSGLTLKPQDRVQQLSRRARSSWARASAPMRLEIGELGSRIGRASPENRTSLAENSRD